MSILYPFRHRLLYLHVSMMQHKHNDVGYDRHDAYDHHGVKIKC